MTPFKLFKENKENGVFIKACVIAASNEKEQCPDCREQIYTPDEIATILSTEANNCIFDFNHDNEELNGINVIQNYQTKTEETIDGVKIPVGSWIKIIFSENSFINNGIREGKIRGVSTDLEVNTTQDHCQCNKDLPPGINTSVYSDIPEKECLIQSYLSFVDYPCNLMPLEAYGYDEYKLNNGDDSMGLKEAMKLLNNKKKDETLKLESAEDVMELVNKIVDAKIGEQEEAIKELFNATDEDIEALKNATGDAPPAKGGSSDGTPAPGSDGGEGNDPDDVTQDEMLKNILDIVESNQDSLEAITTALQIDVPDEPGSNDNSDGGVQSRAKDKSKAKPDNDKLTEILNKIDKLENDNKKKPVIKNQAFLKNIKKNEGRKGIFNRE
jgi:hypothetical protein